MVGKLSKNGSSLKTLMWKSSQLKENVIIRIRRKKRKGQGGEISIPVEVDQKELRKQLKEKLETKEYTIGEMIVPRQVNSKKKM